MAHTDEKALRRRSPARPRSRKERAAVLRGNAVVAIGPLAVGIRVALPLGIEREDDVSVLGERLSRIPVQLLRSLNRAVDDHYARPPRRSRARHPDVAREGGAVALGEQHGEDVAVALRPPAVQANVSRAAVHMVKAEVAGRVAPICVLRPVTGEDLRALRLVLCPNRRQLRVERRRVVRLRALVDLRVVARLVRGIESAARRRWHANAHQPHEQKTDGSASNPSRPGCSNRIHLAD